MPVKTNEKRPVPPLRKKYTRPTLTCFGRFADLVQGFGGNKGDGKANKSRA